MTQKRYPYIETAVGKIGQVLHKVFDSVGKAETKQSRRGQSSFVLIAESRDDFENVDNLIETFSKVHPSRFFVLYVDDSLADVKAEVSGTSYVLGGGEKVLCDVIRLGAPRGALRAIPNVVRANLFTGMRLELFLHSSAIDLEVIDLMAPLADQVFFDSAEFEHDLEIVSHLQRLCDDLVDLQWVRLGVWRDQLKSTFQRPAFREILARLSSIEVFAASRKKDCQAACALLMGGYMLHSLKLEPVAFGAGGYECRGLEGPGAQLVIKTDYEPRESRLNGIRLLSPSGRAELRRASLLETVVEDQGIFKVSRPFDDESLSGLIRRYFLIGESTANYMTSLKLGRELDQLRRGFV